MQDKKESVGFQLLTTYMYIMLAAGLSSGIYFYRDNHFSKELSKCFLSFTVIGDLTILFQVH